MEKRKLRMNLTTRNSWNGFFFVLPFYIGFMLFFLHPLIQSLLFAFHSVKIDVKEYTMSFMGLKNFNYIFAQDADYKINLIFGSLDLFWKVIVISSLFFAMILNQKFFGRGFIRAVFFLPVIIATGVAMDVVQGDMIASSIFTGNVVSGGEISHSSALRSLLLEAGMSEAVTRSITAVFDNMFSLMWKTGIQMIVFLAGLQSISPSLYEASAIEGATAWENFWKITLPMLLPITMVNVIYTIIDLFTDSKNAIMLQVLSNINTLRLGWASAMAWAYFFVIALVLAIVFIVFSRLSRNHS